MTFPVRKLDLSETGVARLLGQFRSATKLRGIVATYLDRWQTIETVVWDLIDHISIDAAEAALLVALGRIVGAGPGNLSDELFRVRIRTRIRINRSAGLTEDLLDVFRLATTGIVGATAQVDDYYPATVLVEAEGPIPGDVSVVIWEALRETKAAGVALYFTAPGDVDVDRLALFDVSLAEGLYPDDEDGSVDLDRGASYDDETSGIGGLLSYVFAA